jgi:hypothetical protein
MHKLCGGAHDLLAVIGFPNAELPESPSMLRGEKLAPLYKNELAGKEPPTTCPWSSIDVAHTPIAPG